jgi:hypothetical protein
MRAEILKLPGPEDVVPLLEQRVATKGSARCWRGHAEDVHETIHPAVALTVGTLSWAIGACAAPAPVVPASAAPTATPIVIGVLDGTTGVTSLRVR